VRRRGAGVRRTALHGAARLRLPALRARVALLSRTVADLEAARRRCAAGVGAADPVTAVQGPMPVAPEPAPPPAVAAPPPAAGPAPAPAPTPFPGQALEVDADPAGGLSFVQATLTAAPGPLRLTLVNAGPGLHTLAVKGNGISAGPTPNVPGGGSAALDLDLPAGTYTFYCTRPGHEAAGMRGTLTVG
jgi:plastocyanin